MEIKCVITRYNAIEKAHKEVSEMKNMIVCAAGGVDVSGVPQEIKILPMGDVHSQKGDFRVDDESFELIRNHFKDRQLDLVIDYEHQTLKDVQAPAGGWIKDIYKTEDAICAKVEWTDKAAEYLKNKEYRYLSPVVIVRKTDRKAVALHSIALTNTPAIDGMFAIVNSLNIDDKMKEESFMDLQEIARLLGLPETATEDEIREALKKSKEPEALKTPEDNPPTEAAACSTGAADPTVLSLLGLKEGATVPEVAASIMSLKAGGAGVQQEVLALKEQLQKRDASEAVEKALKAGKITAAQNDWAMAYALKDLEGFNSFVDKAPVVVPQGKMELKDAPDAKETEDAVTMEILKNCEISMEDVQKYFKKEEE